MADVTMVGALNAALRMGLGSDDRVLVFGEDVGRLGGVFRVTEGLQDEFGAERVFDTPVAEAGIAGVSIGLALAGWRPVAEMQFDGFSYPALDQVISHVAKYRYRTKGRAPVPMVIRIPFGGGIRGKEHHGESPETYYAHTAGLRVVAPSTPLDAYRMLVQSMREPDPVIFLEPKSRYWAKETGELETDGLALNRARIVREGDACVILSYGAMVARSVKAADGMREEEGVGVGVVDLRSLAPLDVETIASAVRATGRAVVVHEAPMTLGLGAEVVSRIMELAFDSLEAPVVRVTGYDTPYPPASLEQHWLPSVERISEAVRRTVEY
ncbi:MAG TPA: alpha-ketoacid dehydrogenase subunit beta [Actinomycetota bacterium]